jgi:hypothetical protein
LSPNSEVLRSNTSPLSRLTIGSERLGDFWSNGVTPPLPSNPKSP